MVMKFSTELQVDAYHGSRGIDLWNGKSWESEIDKNDVSCLLFGLTHFIEVLVLTFSLMFASI